MVITGEVNMIPTNTIEGIPVNQNQQDFIIGVFSISQILRFTRYTKRLIVGYDEENDPIYNPEIQREIENARVEKIADFLIEDPEATFPTNLVLHVPNFVIEKQERKGQTVQIQLSEKVFTGIEIESKNPNAGNVYLTIIDGQHRVRGIEIAIERLATEINVLKKTIPNSKDPQKLLDKLNYYQTRYQDLLKIQLVVSFFVDKTLEYQAMIFATINRTQKRVSESLVYSLFGLTTSDSPQKTALQVVLSLNSHRKSPFYNRINLYGGDYDNFHSPPLSQATMVKSVIDLISENLRESERDRFRKRSDLKTRSSSSTKRLPFRGYYIRNQDAKISDIYFYYFSAVKNTFKRSDGTSLWDFNPERMSPTNILQTTVGYQALMKLLVDLLEKIQEDNRYASKNYEEYLKLVNDINFLNVLRYPFTSRSANVLYYDMSLSIWPPVDDKDIRLKKLNELLEKN